MKFMNNRKTYNLSDICRFVTNRTCNIENYISTENMLPNKGGITSPSNIPSGSAIAYQLGDVLISNIRPYFQKIWQANCDGACSADVLCIRANEKANSKYLYYLLSQQKFFDYVMSGAKGCKMPRGDKSQIMQWQLSLPPLAEQKRIADILSAIDDKIELNRRINANLEQQAQTLYKKWFVTVEKDNWEEKRLGDIIELYDSQRRPLSGQQRANMDKIYPYYGAASLMDYVDNYLFDGIYLLLGEDGTVSDSEGFPMLQYVWGKFWVNNHAHILQGKNGYTTESLYILLKQTNVSSIITGAVQPKISQANLKSIPIKLPPIELLSNYNKIIKPLFEEIRNNSTQINQLSTLRDTLLPKLMSGEINVSTN